MGDTPIGFDLKNARLVGKTLKRRPFDIPELAKKTLKFTKYKDALESALAAASLKRTSESARLASLQFATNLAYLENFGMGKGPKLGNSENMLLNIVRDVNPLIQARAAFLIQLLGVYGADVSGLRPSLISIAKGTPFPSVRKSALNALVWTSKTAGEVLSVVPKSSPLYSRWLYETGIKPRD